MNGDGTIDSSIGEGTGVISDNLYDYIYSMTELSSGIIIAGADKTIFKLIN